MIGSIPTPFLFAIYTVFSVTGMVLVKYGAPMLKAALSEGNGAMYPGALMTIGGALYVAGFLVWMVILTRSPLTVAYPIAVGLTMAFSTLCAVVFLRESMTVGSTVGALLVFVGVALLARG